MKAIKAMGLTKRYKDITAVNGLDLTVEQGELFALLGVNGSGKTTAIKLLSGLSCPDKGETYIFDKSIIKDRREVQKRINVSPQETSVAPLLTVEENLRLIAQLYGINRAGEKVCRSIETFGFTEVRNRMAQKLSGGWKRRLSIAMALISEPAVLFMDEPTLALDVIARRELWEIIRSLKGKVTVILTTHYLEEAECLADRIGIMNRGRLLAAGTREELLSLSGKENFEEAFIRLSGAEEGA